MNQCCIQWKGALFPEFADLKKKEIDRLTKGKRGIPKSYFFATLVLIESTNFCPTCGIKLTENIISAPLGAEVPKAKKSKQAVVCPYCKYGFVDTAKTIKCMSCHGSGVLDPDKHLPPKAMPTTAEDASDIANVERTEGGMGEIGTITGKDGE